MLSLIEVFMFKKSWELQFILVSAPGFVEWTKHTVQAFLWGDHWWNKKMYLCSQKGRISE